MGDSVASIKSSKPDTGIEAVGIKVTGARVTGGLVGDSDTGSGEGRGDGSGTGQSFVHIASSLQ